MNFPMSMYATKDWNLVDRINSVSSEIEESL